MRLSKWLLLVTLLLTVAGCQKTVYIGGKPNPNAYHDAISLSPGTSEIVAGTYMAHFHLVGRTESCNYPKKKVEEIPVIMNGVTPNWEKIASLKPDVILYDADLFKAEDLAKAKDLGIQLFAFDIKTIDDYLKRMYELGSMTGGEVEINDQMDYVTQARRLAQTNAPAKKVKTAFMLPGENGEHMILGVEGFQASIAKESGGDVVGPAGRLFQPLNAETLIGQNPELIITSGDPTPILRDPRLKSVKAVQTGNVQGIEPDILLRKGMRIKSLIEAISTLIVKAAK